MQVQALLQSNRLQIISMALETFLEVAHLKLVRVKMPLPTAILE
jgi:hypothetical protein